MMGPVDYVAVGFRGNNFDGSMMREIIEATKQNIIRVLDLVFIIKDRQGAVVEGEYADQSDDLKRTFGDFALEEDLPLLTESDIAKIGEQMENNTAAGVLVIEHVWARGLKQAISKADGFLIADGRIHSDSVETAMNDLAHSNV